MLIGNSPNLLTSLGVILTLLCVSITFWELGPMHLCLVESPGHSALPCMKCRLPLHLGLGPKPQHSLHAAAERKYFSVLRGLIF